MNHEYLLPRKSGIEWSDVYRLASNNNIGRRRYQPYINTHDDAGHCLEDLINDLLDQQTYVMANRYEFGAISDAEFAEIINTLAQTVAEKRGKDDEPFEYWRLVIGNCRRLMAEAMA